MTRKPSPWMQLPTSIRTSLGRAWSSGVPSEASALHARWWQLETWLRSLVYVELRARFGVNWVNEIPQKAQRNARNEANLAYMSSPDAELILSYLDIFDLFDLIDKNWHLFEASLIDKQVWQGRTGELRQIRHRIAHCRRPHSDDLSRIEQTLRDLEQGAFRAVIHYNNREMPSESLNDDVVNAWIRRSHADAQRLVLHAESNYEIYFRLSFSRRPWAGEYRESQPISGRQGYLWHASFNLHSNGFELSNLWNNSDIRDQTKDRIILLCAGTPHYADISFAAFDEPESVSDAIGDCFDAIINASRSDWNRGNGDLPDYDLWTRRGAHLDPRVHVSTPWAVVDNNTTWSGTVVPINMFSAGTNGVPFSDLL